MIKTFIRNSLTCKSIKCTKLVRYSNCIPIVCLYDYDYIVPSISRQKILKSNIYFTIHRCLPGQVAILCMKAILSLSFIENLFSNILSGGGSECFVKLNWNTSLDKAKYHQT